MAPSQGNNVIKFRGVAPGAADVPPTAEGRTLVAGFLTLAAARQASEHVAQRVHSRVRVRVVERERSFQPSGPTTAYHDEIDVTRPACGASLGAAAGSAGVYLAGALRVLPGGLSGPGLALVLGGIGAVLGGVIASATRQSSNDAAAGSMGDTDYLLIADVANERTLNVILRIIQEQTSADWVEWGHTAVAELIRPPGDASGNHDALELIHRPAA
ncbi:MAG: hypothetical protein QOF51_4090 [Chloroflexota bacterium]|jgi:hypothetical protein|nr:hypothetical protein [Chloroflexota bacterium]